MQTDGVTLAPGTQLCSLLGGLVALALLLLLALALILLAFAVLLLPPLVVLAVILQQLHLHVVAVRPAVQRAGVADPPVGRLYAVCNKVRYWLHAAL